MCCTCCISSTCFGHSCVHIQGGALQRTEASKCYLYNIIYYYTYLLTYSMVQSPSWEANWFAASQKIPRIWRNPKVHYRTHKRPPPVSILGQPNPVHIPTSHLLDIHPNYVIIYIKIDIIIIIITWYCSTRGTAQKTVMFSFSIGKTSNK